MLDRHPRNAFTLWLRNMFTLRWTFFRGRMHNIYFTMISLLLAVLCFACNKSDAASEQTIPTEQQQKNTATAQQKETVGQSIPDNPQNALKASEDAPVAHGHVHDPANPPIDCPLRKQGIDPTQMKPFEQIEAYIQFLDREDRKIWQKPDEVVESMHLLGSERVLDLGAGSGYFSFPIAAKLSSGRLYAADVEPEMIRHIHHNAMLKGIQNIEVKLIDAQHPERPDNIDIVFMCDVMHHIANPVEWMSGIVKQLPGHAKFHIIEFRQGDIPNGPPESAKIAPEKLIEIATKAGLQLDHKVEAILPYQNYYIFKK